MLGKGAGQLNGIIQVCLYTDVVCTAIQICLQSGQNIFTLTFQKDLHYMLLLRCLFFMKRDYITTKAVIDLVGLLQAIDDILTDAGVIEDDCCRIVAGHDGSRVRHDKENPRVEIEITDLEGEL